MSPIELKQGAVLFLCSRLERRQAEKRRIHEGQDDAQSYGVVAAGTGQTFEGDTKRSWKAKQRGQINVRAA